MKITILGVQGSGKSTQAKLLGERLHLPVIDVGELIRASCLAETEENRQACESMRRGDLVPNAFAASVLRNRLKGLDCADGFILDGYPRNLEQLQDFDPQIDKAVFIDIDDKVAIRRLLARGRVDDSLEGIKKRMSWYYDRTLKVLEFYKSLGKLYTLNGNKDQEAVFADIVVYFEN